MHFYAIMKQNKISRDLPLLKKGTLLGKIVPTERSKKRVSQKCIRLILPGVRAISISSFFAF